MSDNKSNGQDPWGRRPNDGPPDLMALLKRLFGQKKGPVGSVGSGGQAGVPVKGRHVALILLVIIAIWALSGIFIVQYYQEAAILRFGRYVKTVGEGPHWIARGFEREITVNVDKMRTFQYQSEMLTRDENIVSVAVVVQYRIASLDPATIATLANNSDKNAKVKPQTITLNPDGSGLKNYLFNVVQPEKTLEQATSSVLRQVIGEMKLDAIITTERQEVSEKVKSLLEKVMAKYNCGLSIQSIAFQKAKAPQEVRAAFDDVNKAREDKYASINRANKYNGQQFAVVKGQIARITQKAKAYAQQVVQKAKGTTARYLALLSPYVKAPEVTRERLYLDAMQNVLSKTSNVVIDTKGSNNVLYLPIDRMLKQGQLISQSPTVADSANIQAAIDQNNTGAVDTSTPQNTGYGAITRPSYTGEN